MFASSPVASSMSDLSRRIRAFLEAGGFAVDEVTSGFLLAIKTSSAQPSSMGLWVVERQSDVTDEKQEAFVSFLRKAKDQQPSLKAHIVRKKGVALSGIRKAFGDTGMQGEVTIQSTIEFVDSAYAQREQSAFGEGGRKFGRIARDQIIALAKNTQRVEQPFFVWRSLYDFSPLRADGPDLLVHLRRDLRELGERPAIRFVIGPAGMGKSILYNQLFSELYEEFIDKKGHDEESSRPISFLPRWVWEERHGGASIEKVADLVKSICSTHGLRPTQERQMASWLLKNGHTIWMMDGLDEFFSGATDFEPFLRELVSAPSQAKILIFMRDAVFSTGAQNFINFFSGYEDKGIQGLVRIYQLAPWSLKECRSLTWLRFENRLPRPAEQDTPSTQAFLHKAVTAELDELLQVPYYCGILIDRYKSNPRDFATNEFDLIEEGFCELLTREEEKLIPADPLYKDWQLFHDRSHLVTLLSFIAYNFCVQRDRALERERQYIGSNLDELRSYIYDEDFDPSATAEQRKHARLSLFQMPLFSSASDGGYIEFAQELMAEYLAGKFVWCSASEDTERFCEYVGKYFFDTSSLFCRYLSSELKKKPNMVAELMRLIRSDAMKMWYRRNIIQLVINAAANRGVLREDTTVLQERNLYGLHFSALDLTDASFRDADLVKCIFDKCALTRADFQGVRLQGTRFDAVSARTVSAASLSGARQFSQVFINDHEVANASDFTSCARALE